GPAPYSRRGAHDFEARRRYFSQLSIACKLVHHETRHVRGARACRLSFGKILAGDRRAAEPCPMTEPLLVLLVDDDEDDYRLTRDLLLDISDTRFTLDW